MNLSYTMKEGMTVAKLASSDIEKYLEKLPETVEVINVENDPKYQEKDIDIVWVFLKENGEPREITIEVKGDRYETTGNYFFETISNKSKKTPGCFMYTEADYLYYYFVNIKELHRIPVDRARKWFKAHFNEFKERETRTPVKKNEYYITVGRLVPKVRVRNSIKGIRIKELTEYL